MVDKRHDLRFPEGVGAESENATEPAANDLGKGAWMEVVATGVLFTAVFLFFLSYTLYVGMLVLRAACWMAGVKGPASSQALPATALVMFITLPIGLFALCIELSLDLGSHLEPMLGSWADSSPVLIFLPIHLLFSAFIYSGRLEGVTFGQGILIWLAQLMVPAMAGAVLYAAYFIVRLALGQQSLFEMIGLGG